MPKVTHEFNGLVDVVFESGTVGCGSIPPVQKRGRAKLKSGGKVLRSMKSKINTWQVRMEGESYVNAVSLNRISQPLSKVLHRRHSMGSRSPTCQGNGVQEVFSNGSWRPCKRVGMACYGNDYDFGQPCGTTMKDGKHDNFKPQIPFSSWKRRFKARGVVGNVTRSTQLHGTYGRDYTCCILRSIDIRFPEHVPPILDVNGTFGTLQVSWNGEQASSPFPVNSYLPTDTLHVRCV